MNEFVNITKKYGVTGVLACWLWLTNDRVEALENKLVNCYQFQMMKNAKTQSKITDSFMYAILPEKLKIKKALKKFKKDGKQLHRLSLKRLYI